MSLATAALPSPIRDNATHVLSVGGVLAAVDKGERTSVHFFEVIAVPNEFYVVVRKLGKRVESSNARNAWVTPEPGCYVSEPIRVRARGDGVAASRHYEAHLWDGAPLVCSRGL